MMAFTRAAASAWRTGGSRSSISQGAISRSSNEDGTVWIAFNGEVYNFEELNRQFLSSGHRSGRGPTRRRSFICMRNWARSVSPNCAACSPSRCGTRAKNGCCWPGTGSARNRSTTPGTAGGWSSGPKSRRCGGGRALEGDGSRGALGLFLLLICSGAENHLPACPKVAAGALHGSGRNPGFAKVLIGISDSTRRSSFPRRNGATSSWRSIGRR